MLEERGVKYELEHDLYVEWVDARGNEVTAFETSCRHKGDVLIVHVFLTPEQAIAATLGASNESVRTLIDDMLDFIGNCCNTTLDCACCDPVDCKYLDGDGELAECTRYQHFRNRAKVIAATLGSERDEIYNAGFDSGVKACLQILDGYLDYPHSAVENISKWVDEQWKERKL